MKTIKYLRMKAANATAVLMFTPANTYSTSGSAYSGFGLPSGYTPSIHGACIWPAGKSAGTSGWVGIKFVPTQPTINIQFACDNGSSVYLNNQLVMTTSSWSMWYSATLNVIPGRAYALSASVYDSGGAYGFAGRAYYNDGTPIVMTSTSWVSA